MVRGRVDTVNSDSCNIELLEEWQIARATIAVGKRVDEGRGLSEWVVRVCDDSACTERSALRVSRLLHTIKRTLWLIRYAFDEEPAAIRVEEIFALSGDFLNGGLCARSDEGGSGESCDDAGTPTHCWGEMKGGKKGVVRAGKT